MKKLVVFILLISMVASLSVLSGCDENEDMPSTTSRNTTTTNSDTNTTTVAPTTDNDVQDTTTTTTVVPDTTTTTQPESTTTKTEDCDPDIIRRGVINEPTTKTILIYDVDEDTYEVGNKKERTITYKGTIKIGSTAASTGKYTSVGVAEMLGVESYLNKINYEGGIGGDYDNGVQGYYLEFFHYDSWNDAYNSRAYTKKLVEEDKVFAIIANDDTTVLDTSVLNYIKNAGLVAVCMSSSAELYMTDVDYLRSGATIFPIAPICTTEGYITAGQLLKNYSSARKVGIIFNSDEDNIGFKDGAMSMILSAGEEYECVNSKLLSASDADIAVGQIADCDAVILATNATEASKVIEYMIDNGVYKPVFMPRTLAQSSIIANVKYKYASLSDENKFAVYSNTWLSATDVEPYLEFASDTMSYCGGNEYINNTSSMYGWIAANILCEGIERVIKSGKEITVNNYIDAMESSKIKLPMGSSPSGDTFLKYQGGYRIGVIRMGLLKSSGTFDYFVEYSAMQDFEKFLKTGDIKYIK